MKNGKVLPFPIERAAERAVLEPTGAKAVLLEGIAAGSPVALLVGALLRGKDVDVERAMREAGR
jgi:hypothetical protein